MPEARRDSAKNTNSTFNEIETTTSESNASAHSKQQVVCNRTNSIDASHIPLFERHYAASTAETSRNRRRTISVAGTPERDQCYCCCSSHSTDLNSCWKLKRRQIIWESSHASAQDSGATTATAQLPKLTTSLLPAATRRRQLGEPIASNLVQRRESGESRGSSASNIARRVQKVSTSLPGTPNLSQLRRAQRVQYKKLSLDASDDSAQQQQPFAHTIHQLQMSATRPPQRKTTVTSVCSSSGGGSNNNTEASLGRQQMIITDQLLAAVGDDGGVDSKLCSVAAATATARATTTAGDWAHTQQDVSVQVDAENNNYNNNNNNNNYDSLSAQSMNVAGVTATSATASTQTQTDSPVNNNNKNSDNDQSKILQSLPLSLPLPLPMPLPLPTPGQIPAMALAPATTTIQSPSATAATPPPTITSSTAQTVAKSSLAFCEHCCERASVLSSNGSYTHGAHAVRRYAAEDSDRFYRAAADSVSDLSSYRFVSDEDEFSVRTASEPVAESSNKRTPLAANVASRSPRAVPPTVLQQPPTSTSARSSVLSSTATAIATAAAAPATAKVAPARLGSPTICCYTIEKPASIHYNATVLEYVPTVNANLPKTAPVPIPLSSAGRNASDSSSVIEESSGEGLLSTSLPSNYGSERNSEFHYQRLKTASKKHIPPTPPPKPKQGLAPNVYTFASDRSSYDYNAERLYAYSYVPENSQPSDIYYDPNSFQRRVLKFENDTAYSASVAVGGNRVARSELDSGSAERHSQRLSRSLERSLSPEHCELLNCFGTAKNTRAVPNTAPKHNNGEFGCENVTASVNNVLKEDENANASANENGNFVARGVSQSSCLPLAPIASEKCAINNKNNQHRHQHGHQQFDNRNANYNNHEGNRKVSIASSASGCGESNNNNYNCKIKHRANNSQSLPVPVSGSIRPLACDQQHLQQESLPYLSSSLPKRTLRYDSNGRLKLERISHLPTPTALVNGRKSASETRLHRVHRNVANAHKSERPPLSVNNAKLTPTVCRKFNYLRDRFEDCVTESDELEESVASSPTSHDIITTVAEYHGDQISAKNGTATALDTSTSLLTPNSSPTHAAAHASVDDLNFIRQHLAEAHEPEIFKSFSDSQNFVAHHKAIQVHNNNNNNHTSTNNNEPERCYSEFSLKSDFPHSDSSISCKCASSKQPQSPTTTNTHTSPISPLSPISLTSSGLSQKNSHSLPSVPHSNGTQSPVWLSSETIESRFSEQRGPDDVLSNCSDQTTIFHLDNDCPLSVTSSSPSAQLYAQSQAVNTVLRGPLILKRIPAIQSFGYIPQHSNSLDSANVCEHGDKEINMEKRRNTLDRFQRLGFGRKSTPSNASNAAAAQQQSERSGSTQNRKSSEKSEKLRELTELLRGNRSSPTPPPVPPPRKPRNGSQSASNSFEKSDATRTVAPLATGASVDGEASLFMSNASDDIMLMDQDEPAADTQHSADASKSPSVGYNLQQKNVNTAAASDLAGSSAIAATSTSATTMTAAASTSTSSTMTTRLYNTLKPNTSLTNFESLMALGREKSKSPPPSASSHASGSGGFDAELIGSTDIATKLARPESRTIIGSYAQKGIPFRSASFSQIDLSSGKFKKSSWSALRDRLWRDKVVGSADSATSSSVTSRSVGTSTVPKASTAAEEKAKAEPDWIYIPLKKKTEMSINLNYGQEMKNLDNVIEPHDVIPEEDIFGTDTEQTSSITEDSKDMASASNIVIAHAKMESLTDTIHSENDYAMEEQQVPATIESVAAVVEASEEAKEKAEVIEQPTIKEPTKAKLEPLEPNVATLMEEKIPLESPPDNFLQTATTCVIPVPVYECAAQEWRMENPPQEWVEVAPEEFGVIPETIGPVISLEQCAIATAETKKEQEYRAENVPTISVSRSSEEADDKCILRRKENLGEEQGGSSERRQSSVDHPEVKKRYSHDDMDIGKEMRSSLDAITTRHSADERKRIDKSKRRKGMYIDNATWSDTPVGAPHSRGLALDISIANFNAIKPDSPEECDIMYINSPPTDENRTPGSFYSPDLNTPESECNKPPVWTKAERLTSFSCQSSEEKDDVPCGVDSYSGLPRNNKSFPFLRTDSVSDNESDRTPPHSRDRASPSPAPGDYDFKRYSKRPLRGPYGQMLEAEMKKPNKMHFEEILEDLRESEATSQPRRQRVAQDDASCGTSSGSGGSGARNLPHHSNSMRVRKTSTYLPVPAHTRAASTPSQIENVSKSGGGMDKINPHEKRYQSTLDNSVCDDKDCHETGHHYHHHHQRDVKRAASEAPAPKGHHSKRTQSMSGDKVSGGVNQAAHQQKRSLDVTSTGSVKHKGGAGAGAGAGKGGAVVPSQELLAELLKGSSEKLLSEQRQQMSADTRTHVVQEIFRNEQSYVESLQTIVTKYLKVLKSPEHAGMIDTRTVDEIFFMVPDILEIHEKFLAELRTRLDNWDAMQKVGDAFLETFSKLEVLEVYTSFVNNCNRAKNAIRTTKHQRPSFAKFLETTAREHKGKLTLDNLLIKPVQKFPNYEMLFQRLIKHTDHDHPDQKHLQDVLKLVHDILVHINCKEREILENGQREATLRELEGFIEGITDLIAPDRQFLLFDLVSMPSGQGARKERGFFLFNDLLVLTSIKKRSGTIRKPNTSTCPGTVASTLDTNKYKFLTKISLDCLEIVKTKDENVKRIMNEIENLAEDCNKLQQIADITASLKYPHQYLEDVIRELLRDVQRQLSERQTNDAQLNMLELMVNSPNGSQKLSVVFSKAEKRTQWEETFNEAKQKLASTLERHPIPEFLMSIPIRKTRAGLQFTCAAATLSEKRDVWVCNSDGYVGQVCIMSLYPEPNVTSCNGVCNARILCVASVPAYSPNSSNAAMSAQQQQQQQRPQQERNSTTSTPQHSYTQQLRDYRKSISPVCQTPSVIGTPEKKKTPSSATNASTNTTNSNTASNNNNNGNSHNNSDVQLDLNLSSSDEEADASAVGGGATMASGSVGSGGTASSSGSTTERVPSPAPSTQTTASNSTASTAVMGSVGGSTPYHSHQDSNPEEGESNLSTMWIGTEDGCIHVYNSTDNIRIKKNRIKIEHQSAVYSILYLDNRVFVSLANGDICVYLRDGAAWNTSSSHCLSIGTVSSPVTKLLNVHGKLWCSIQGIIKVLDVETLLVVNQIQISSDSKPITNMTVSNNYVWISIQNSAHIKCFHSISHQLITEVNLAPAVNKMLSNCDEIIRQHKAACLRVTSLLSCRDLIWIGTSAGVLLTIPAQGYEKGAPNVVPTGIPHGHTGHVRFLTFVETSGLSSEGSGSSTSTSSTRDSESGVSSTEFKSQGSIKHSKPKSESSNILIISGGDGYEDFRNSGANSLSEIAGREDSTNHLLIWQI